MVRMFASVFQLYPSFGLLVMSAPGFKVRMEILAWNIGKQKNHNLSKFQFSEFIDLSMFSLILLHIGSISNYLLCIPRKYHAMLTVCEYTTYSLCKGESLTYRRITLMKARSCTFYSRDVYSCVPLSTRTSTKNNFFSPVTFNLNSIIFLSFLSLY